MTTDDLRTRAREAAWKEGRRMVLAGELDRSDLFDRGYHLGFTHGFGDGALWHAAQQPTREQIARALFEAADTFGDRWEDVAEAHRARCYSLADAVLALCERGKGD